MQQQLTATRNEYHFGAQVFSMDTVAEPDHAEKWVRMCSRTPALANRWNDLYLAAQLTLMAYGRSAEIAAC